MTRHCPTLREVKHARTKLDIANAFVRRLRTSRYEEISIRELCRSVEISEGTFFNYFPEKIDIIHYHMSFLILKTVWTARQTVPPGRPLDLIEEAFARMAEELHSANLGYQLISIMVNQQLRPKIIDIPPLEKRLAFPRCEGIEKSPIVSLPDFFKECIREAKKRGDLPDDVVEDDVVISLLAIMAGTLIAAKLETVKDKAHQYRRQLGLLWKGLGARVGMRT